MIKTPGTQGKLEISGIFLCFILYATAISRILYAAYSMQHSKNLKEASRNPRTRTTFDQDYFLILPNPTTVHRPTHP